MSAPTPDRAALAERLRLLKGYTLIAEDDQMRPAAMSYVKPSEFRDLVLALADAAAAALAAPAVPPSVAEARATLIAWLEARSTPTSPDLTYSSLEAALGRYAAAVRAATVAEAVRAVEGEYADEGNHARGTDAESAFLRAILVLRALGGQP